MRRDRVGRRNSAPWRIVRIASGSGVLPIEVRCATKTAVTASRFINLRITGASVSMSAIYLRTIEQGEHAA
jgi:hypothetical protein